MNLQCHPYKKKGAGPIDVRDQCGKLTLLATDDVDAVTLAHIADALIHPTADKAFMRWRKNKLMTYCKKHNVRIKIET